ncbi:polysaccharide deacetylase family protein [Methylocaldum sp.]|uniref:polysaccharide deacetylase family protein n=1 Tax=Methylocaldum sp. TaxID=1969727 RepID=UPI002D52020A|nr:polysaccharide deacetylase family protein [Methylocaldum sp.]HYE37871.1 polysaccharide deacetylase family protein [Methylocaldum sp.]
MRESIFKHLRLFIVLSLICLPFPVLSEIYVLFTVDVESFAKGNPKENIWGRMEGYDSAYGVPKILELLARNGSKATFYLNVYEIAKFGDEDIKGIAQKIVAEGQDLELHTHPSPMYDEIGMSLFSLEEQEEILRKGKDLIREWTGKEPIAHRAGAYMANSNTLRALKKLGMSVDSSLSPAYGSVALLKEGYNGNDIQEIEGILEIPITYFKQMKLGSWESKRFLDVESSSLAEMKDVLDEMAENDACAVNIMMHSFSLNRYGKPDERVVDKLDALLKYVNEHPKLQSANAVDFYNAYRDKKLSCTPKRDLVPYTGFVLTYLRAWERFDDGWKNIAFALSLPGALAIAVSPILIGRLNKRRPPLRRGK